MIQTFFLTTTNLATNPRLVKEVKLALDLSFSVSLVIFKLGNWSDTKSQAIANELKERGELKLYYCSATRSVYISWLLWGVAERLARLVYPLIPYSVLINALASSRRSLQLLWACDVIKSRPDLICAHNLGALYPAWRLSNKWKVPFVFDVEDYHPGEFIRFDAGHEKKRREFLMKKLLPHASALTSASPLIGIYTLKLIGGHPNHQAILNSFPQEEFSDPTNQQINESTNQPINESTNQLNLIWFSQKISFGRGLEQLFEAMNLWFEAHNATTESLDLTIIGDLDPEFDAKIIAKLKNGNVGKHLHILPPMTQMELHKSLAIYDVGLALEFDDSDLNRQLCLTNKMLAYAQAGLYILATDTPAQKQFIQDHYEFGLLCGQSPEAIRDGLKVLMRQRETVRLHRHERFINAQEMAWDKEASRIESLWKWIT